MVSAFPTRQDVFLPLVDGFTPITASDINEMQDALRKIEETIGGGEAGGSGYYGAKGSAVDVKTRLNTFLETYGGLKGVAFVTQTVRRGDFSEDGSGAFFGFGKTLREPYVVLFTSLVNQTHADGTRDQSGGPMIPWVAGKAGTGCWIKARKAGKGSNPNNIITQDEEDMHKCAILVFGIEASYVA